MSRKVEVQFDVRNMAIMRDTLTKMGINYTELNENHLQVPGRYNNIDIQPGIISHDDMDKRIDKIKQNYMVNFYKDKAIREGNQIREEVTASGEIILHVVR